LNFQKLSPETKAMTWPLLSYMCHVRWIAASLLSAGFTSVGPAKKMNPNGDDADTEDHRLACVIGCASHRSERKCVAWAMGTHWERSFMCIDDFFYGPRRAHPTTVPTVPGARTREGLLEPCLGAGTVSIVWGRARHGQGCKSFCRLRG